MKSKNIGQLSKELQVFEDESAQEVILLEGILDKLEKHSGLESIEDQLRKSRERILRLKDLSMKLRVANGLQALENEPAYKRKLKKLEKIHGLENVQSIAPTFYKGPNKEEKIKELEAENKRLKNFIYSDVLATSDVKMQLVPVNIYLDCEVPETIYQAYQSVLDLLPSIGFETLFEFESERGSWIKRLIGVSKEAINSEEVRKRLREAEYGIEVNAILKQQSEIDRNQSEALMNILKSVETIPNAAIRIGSLLVVKLTNTEGEVNVQVRSLSISELFILNKNPELLHKPSQILTAISRELATDIKNPESP
ncbi:hypothetical protein [Pedobacter sp. SYSU D00535]|uniref:hypothetical protein n=1 Tax=Pedobacter sp. SYSU D00535 TaxID=2810308 RepID=UPI001A961C6A|nr:hypothetical protein [Pedobacter sp. SYSU D00535]